MNLSRFIAFLALIGLSFISALLFEARMNKGFTIELIVIFLGVIFAIIATTTLLEGESSGWFLATLIFGAALVNGIVLFLITKTFSLLILAVIINITGMIFSVLSAAEADDEDDFDDKDFDLETYDDEDEIEKKSKKRTYKKRKATKKKRKYKRRR